MKKEWVREEVEDGVVRRKEVSPWRVWSKDVSYTDEGVSGKSGDRWDLLKVGVTLTRTVSSGYWVVTVGVARRNGKTWRVFVTDINW